MLGAIVGAMVGSSPEFQAGSQPSLPLGEEAFSNGTVLTVATADALLRGRDYREVYQAWRRRCMRHAAGSRSRAPLPTREQERGAAQSPSAAVRAIPIGWAFSTLRKVLAEAERSAAVTDDRPESIRGAQAAAGCVFLARNGASKAELRAFLGWMIGYRVDQSLAQLRSRRSLDAEGAASGALLALLESRSFDDALRKAVSLGRDAASDAAIAGGVAEALYRGVPERVRQEAVVRLAPEMRVVLSRFVDRFVDERGGAVPLRRVRVERVRLGSPPQDPYVGSETL